MRIDIHHHAIVPKIQRLMRRQGAPFTIPWSLGSTLEVMERGRIGFALVSNAIPGELFASPRQAARFTRAANEAVAELVGEHPDRFGLLAAVPMPHLDAALAEVEYAYRELGADGIVLVPHAGDSYLGDPLFAPLLSELDSRGAVVLVHPMALPGDGRPPVPPVLADFLLDTTRGALSLAAGDALDRYPRIDFVLAHGGGFLPYVASRIIGLGQAFYGLDAARLEAALRRFYYDTALTGPSGLPSLLRTVPADRILFGSDWCAAPAELVVAGCAALDAAAADLSTVDRRRIDRDNALSLFPRVARRLRVAA